MYVYQWIFNVYSKYMLIPIYEYFDSILVPIFGEYSRQNSRRANISSRTFALGKCSHKHIKNIFFLCQVVFIVIFMRTLAIVKWRKEKGKHTHLHLQLSLIRTWTNYVINWNCSVINHALQNGWAKYWIVISLKRQLSVHTYTLLVVYMCVYRVAQQRTIVDLVNCLFSIWLRLIYVARPDVNWVVVYAVDIYVQMAALLFLFFSKHLLTLPAIFFVATAIRSSTCWHCATVSWYV